MDDETSAQPPYDRPGHVESSDSSGGQQEVGGAHFWAVRDQSYDLRRAALVADDGLRSVRLRAPSQPPVTTEAETLENAVAMMERLQGLYLRTLEALQAQRKAPRVPARNSGMEEAGGRAGMEERS
jgi:hypothetical protein